MIEKTIQALNDLDFSDLDMYEKSAAEKERDIQVAELERIKRSWCGTKLRILSYKR